MRTFPPECQSFTDAIGREEGEILGGGSSGAIFFEKKVAGGVQILSQF